MIQNVELEKKRLNAGRLGKSTLNWLIVFFMTRISHYLGIWFWWIVKSRTSISSRSTPFWSLIQSFMKPSYVSWSNAVSLLYSYRVSFLTGTGTCILLSLKSLGLYDAFIPLFAILLYMKDTNRQVFIYDLDFHYTTSSSFFKI